MLREKRGEQSRGQLLSLMIAGNYNISKFRHMSIEGTFAPR